MRLKLPLITTLLATAALAQPFYCDGRIDPPLPGTGPMAAINSLLDVGVDVRVRILTDLTYPTLDAWESAVRRGCPSWQAEGGNRKNNLIIFVVATSAHKSGIYYGAQWAPLLNWQWTRIQSQRMNPRFRDGDITGGLAAGMGEVHRLILQSTAPPATIINQMPPSDPVDLSGLLKLLGWILVISVGAGCVVFFLGYLRWLKEENEARTGAQQGALIAQQEATGLITESSSWELTGDAKALLDSAVKTYADLGWGPTDPKLDGLTASQYSAIQDAYRKVSIDIRAAKHLGGDDGPLSSHSADSPLPGSPHVHGKKKQQRDRSYPPQPIRERVVYEEHYHDNGPIVPPIIVVDASPRYAPPADKPSYPTHSDPSPSWGSSGDSGGGSTDFGSSYPDSGSSSSDFGSSDSGGGGSSDW